MFCLKRCTDEQFGLSISALPHTNYFSNYFNGMIVDFSLETMKVITKSVMKISDIDNSNCSSVFSLSLSFFDFSCKHLTLQKVLNRINHLDTKLISLPHNNASLCVSLKFISSSKYEYNFILLKIKKKKHKKYRNTEEEKINKIWTRRTQYSPLYATLQYYNTRQ